MILILLFLIILGTVGYSKFVLKRPCIKIGDYSIFIVLTGSMKPTISPGEMILIKEKAHYNKDDIVTYMDEDNYFITHRIIQTNDSISITKGDNNNVQDSPIENNRILGSVVYHSKLLGFFILYLLKPLTIIYICTLLFFIFKDSFFISEKSPIELKKELKIEKSKN